MTFIVFPGFAFDASVKFLSKVPNEAGWFDLMMNTLFSVFDTLGRKLGGVKSFDMSATAVKVFSVSRTIFLATFVLIAFQVGPSWLFVSDWFIIFNICIFAFTNGYCGTLACVKAPGTVPPEERGVVGGFIGTTITLGILLGSIFALALGPVLKLTPGIA